MPSQTPVMDTFNHHDNPKLMAVVKQAALNNIEYMEKLKKETEKGNSDKENESAEQSTLEAVEKPEETDESEFIDGIEFIEEPVPEFVDLESTIFGLCTGDFNSCTVHNQQNNKRPRWSYIDSLEDFNALLNSLNKMGAREHNLKTNLMEKKDKIVSWIEESLSYRLDYTDKELTAADVKAALRRNLNFEPDVPISHILDSTLRDMILETEEKVNGGMLGSLKVDDRDKWIENIRNDVAQETKNLEYAGRKRLKTVMGPDFQWEEDEDDLKLLSTTPSSTISQLALAILQMGRAVENKYLKAPLAENEKQLARRKKIESRVKKQEKKKKVEAEDDSSSD